MKILYIANEFRDVQVAAKALRGVAPDLTILWGYSADRAAFWIREHHDLAAVVVEVQTDSQGCAFLNHTRSLGLDAPIIVVLPEEAAQPSESLEAGADDYVAKNQSFSRELPIVVTRGIERAQTSSAARWDLFSEVRAAGAVASTPTAASRPGNLDGASILPHRHSGLVEASTALERQEDVEEVIPQERAERTQLQQSLTKSVAALEDAARREAELISTLADVTERQAAVKAQFDEEVEHRRNVEELLARSEIARDDAETRHEAAMTTAAALFAERQAQLDADVAEAVTARTALLQEAQDLEAALKGAEQILASHAGDIERLTQREVELNSMLADATASRNVLAGRLTHIETALKDAEECAARDRVAAVEKATEREADLARQLAAERAEAQRNLEDARREFQRTLDALSNEYADAQARLVASLSERDARLEEQARHAASLKAVELDRSKTEDGLRASLAARAHEIEEIQRTLKATALELVSARTRCESMQTSAPQLQRQLDESRLEARRQFHRAPVALGRCTPDGTLTHLNRAFADLAGYRNPNELRGAEFATTLFESPDDLSWLIERCVSTHARASIETAWKTKQGERVVVRLSALESAPDLIEIAAEDITDLRALQDRLGQAHRLEAVGRLASEIAVTCGNLLKEIRQDAQQWLAAMGDDTGLRQRGERLLEDVTRADGFLQKLNVYGDEQAKALEGVDLDKVLRDMTPVLKHVVGDEVVLELPKASSPLYVDLTAERVERLLVNLARGARERMTQGGRLKFEVATVVATQRFLAQYPTVRPGAHALITATEARRATRGERSLQLLASSTTTSDMGGIAAEKPGVDLGALQEFIRECGGHLWMTVEPAGNMIVKIHLPLRAVDDQAETPPSDTRSRLGRAAARWFGR